MPEIGARRLFGQTQRSGHLVGKVGDLAREFGMTLAGFLREEGFDTEGLVLRASVPIWSTSWSTRRARWPSPAAGSKANCWR